MYFYDEGINEQTRKLIEGCISDLIKLKVPISNSVYFYFSKKMKVMHGTCSYLKYLKNNKYNNADYKVTICNLIKMEKDIKNVIVHELLHTIPSDFSHKGEWQKWADYVNANSSYTITVTADIEKNRPIEKYRTKDCGEKVLAICPICKSTMWCPQKDIDSSGKYTDYVCVKCNKLYIVDNGSNIDTVQFEKKLNDIIDYKLYVVFFK